MQTNINPTEIEFQFNFEDIFTDNEEESILSNPESNVLPSYYMHESIVNNTFEYLSIPPSYNLYHNDSSELLHNSSISITSSISESLSTLPCTNKIILAIHLDQQSNHDYKQGDTVSGYITLENTSNSTINFSTIYILLEGSISGKKANTFLSMVDFESFISCPIYINENSISQHPFAFRIPNYLLDTECNSVSTHLEIPPSTRNSMFLNDKVVYNLYVYVLREESFEYINVGEVHQEVSIIPQYNEHHNDTCYQSLLSQLFEEVMYFSKDLNSLIANMQLLPLQNSQIIKGTKVSFDPGLLQGLKIKYVSAIPNHPDLNQTLTIPIEFSKSPIKSVTAELIAVIGKSYTSCPMYIEDSMLFESFSNKRYGEIITNPIVNLSNEIQRISPDIDVSDMKALLKLHIYYLNFNIPDVEYSNQEIRINLKDMYRDSHDKSLRCKFGEFNLIPNFQSCFIIRSYYLHLKVKFGWNFNVVINIPVKVVR